MALSYFFFCLCLQQAGFLEAGCPVFRLLCVSPSGLVEPAVQGYCATVCV